MSIAIGVPTGVVNLPTVHMVQTFRGNYVVDNTAFTAVQPKADLYFGTFFYSSVDISGRGIVQADTTVVNSILGGINPTRSYDAASGAYDRTPYSDAGNTGGTSLGEKGYTLPLFAFDFDGVQGAIKAKGDEKWITYKGMYDNTLMFTSTANDGWVAGTGTLTSTMMGYREGRGTWRYKMNEEASMASSIPYSGIAGINEASSTITDKYSTVLGVSTNKVPHAIGRFKLTSL